MNTSKINCYNDNRPDHFAELSQRPVNIVYLSYIFGKGNLRKLEEIRYVNTLVSLRICLEPEENCESNQKEDSTIFPESEEWRE